MEKPTNVLFIDFEYLNKDMDISQVCVCEISFNQINVLFNSYVFYEDLPVKNVADMITSKIAKISTKTLKEEGRLLAHVKQELAKICSGKLVVHWGGDDPQILENLIDLKDIKFHNLMNDFNNFPSKKLISIFANEVSKLFNEDDLNLHCARIDSFLLAAIYKKIFTKTELSNAEIVQLKEYILIKKIKINEYNESYKKSKNARAASELGVFYSKKISVYFTGFDEDEKNRLKDKYQKLGIHSACKKTVKKLTYLIYKDISQKNNYSNIITNHVSLDEFESIIKDFNNKIAS